LEITKKKKKANFSLPLTALQLTKPQSLKSNIITLKKIITNTDPDQLNLKKKKNTVNP